MALHFVSPYTPFLLYITRGNPNGEHFCETHDVYYGLCGHTIRSTHCRSRENRVSFHLRHQALASANQGFPSVMRITCSEVCLLVFDYFTVDLTLKMCPSCELVGHPDPPIENPRTLEAINGVHMRRHEFYLERYYQFARGADEGDNADIMGSSPEQMLENPMLLSQRIRDYVQANDIMGPLSDFSRVGVNDNGSDLVPPLPPSPPNPVAGNSQRPSRVSRTHMTLSRAEWQVQQRELRASEDTAGVALDDRMYYLPPARADETDLLIPLDPAESEGVECGICLESYVDDADGDWRVLPCKHIFHYHDIVAWWQRRTTCPLCRMKLQITIPLFPDEEDEENTPQNS